MFASRVDAGQRLGRDLRDAGVKGDLVLGLPRGGVVVAAEVARILEAPLDVVIVRKIGHPWHREFAVGALAENEVVVFDQSVTFKNPLLGVELNKIIEEEKERLKIYGAKFHRDGLPGLTGKSVLVIDDGLATGATMEAAVVAARKQGAEYITVAVPVASTNAIERLSTIAERVRALWVDEDFEAVGRYYEVFSQTSDEEVIELLRRHPN